MLQSNFYFIQSIVLLVVVSECVFCEKYNIGDISGRIDLKTDVNNKFNEIYSVKNDSSTVNEKRIQSGYNGSALIEEGRKKREESLLSRFLPLLVMPFMMSTMMLPMALTQLKFMLLQAIFLGKLAIIFATFNILKNMGDKSGLYSHNVHLRPPVDHVMKHPDLIKEHYGYTGNEEYGAYVNEK
ncbi:hypothetical protein WA026_009217 [Henosepilachna vigintioctopunctata]|uniref:Uncharacterized protein n=1 Tax=Henosepilachna vigintioctopunctata TaxID=420089 RepID=A0AAW1UYQ8_9CUCU